VLRVTDRSQTGVLSSEENTFEDTVADVLGELDKATKNWPPFNSAHEGYAVLAEEMDELWVHVKTNQKRRDLPAMRKEAIQVAAMAMRFALEVTSEETGRK
jgi:molybdopterin biosynthesis enzyme